MYDFIIIVILTILITTILILVCIYTYIYRDYSIEDIYTPMTEHR